jgi:hypothetical protein
MEKLFETLKYDLEFRIQAVIFLRKTLHITYVNYEALRIDPFPYRIAGPDELLLRFGDMQFSCKILAPNRYAFT